RHSPTQSPFHFFLAFWHPSRQVRGPDNHHISGDDGRRMKPDVPVDQIDLLIVVLFQIDHAALAEAGNGDASFGIERDEPVTWRDVQDSLFVAVSPVRQSMA